MLLRLGITVTKIGNITHEQEIEEKTSRRAGKRASIKALRNLAIIEI